MTDMQNEKMQWNNGTRDLHFISKNAILIKFCSIYIWKLIPKFSIQFIGFFLDGNYKHGQWIQDAFINRMKANSYPFISQHFISLYIYFYIAFLSSTFIHSVDLPLCIFFINGRVREFERIFELFWFMLIIKYILNRILYIDCPHF